MKKRDIVKKVKKYFKYHKKQRLLIIFGIMLLLAIISTLSVDAYLSLQIQTSTVQTDFKVENEVYYLNPIVFETNGPTYFNSYAQIQVKLASEYGPIFKTFNCSASIDNSTWVNVPIAYSTSDFKTKMYVNLGIVKLDSPQITIYVKTFLPPQTINTPSNVTKEQVENNNFHLIGVISPVPSSLDTGKLIFTFLAIFGVIFTIYNFFKSKDIKRNYSKHKKISSSDGKKERDQTLKT